jgi:PAS domain S-box-containing protein
MKKLRLRLAAMVFAISFLLMGGICGIIGLIIGSSTRANFREVALAQMKTSEMSTTLFFEQTWQLLSSLCVDPLIRSAAGKLTVYTEKANGAVPDPSRYGRDELAIAKRFSYVKDTANRITQIELGTADGGYVMFPPSRRMAGYDPRKRPWYENALRASGDRAKTDARLTSDGKNIVVSLVQRVLGPGGEVAGAASISISLTDLSSIIANTRIGYGGYVLLFQDDGVLIVDPKHPEFVFKNVKDVPMKAYAALFEARRGVAGPRVRIGGHAYDSCFQSFENLGFIEAALVDEEDVSEQLRPLILSLIIITIVVAGFTSAIFLIITLREHEDIIKDRERYFRHIFEDVQLLVLGVNIDNKIQFANDFLLEWGGYRRESILLRNWQDVFLPPESELKELSPALLDRTDTSFQTEGLVTNSGGEKRTVAWTITANLDTGDGISGMTLIGEDVTEKRLQEALIKKTLKEKELLLKELHHRVKNNLQLVSSLLSLQEREASGSEVRSLMDARDRIQSLALVHEHLYSSNDYSSIDFGEYASLVIDSLVANFTGSAIAFETDFAPVTLSLEEAIPSGLILNEALTNVLKYAFPAGWTGPRRVVVRIGTTESGKRLLEIRDFGVGTPEGFDFRNTPSLGCTIMRLLAQQLNGKLSITRDNGTRVLFLF